MKKLPQQKVIQPNSLYQQDFYLWTESTANLLREAKFSQLDLANLIEEVESMGKSEKRELKSRLIILLMHLLKWKYQPAKRSQTRAFLGRVDLARVARQSWRSTISEQRISLEELLEDSPSLQPFLLEVFAQCYQKSRIKAASETGINLELFPEESPFTDIETLDFTYLPT